TTRLSFPDGSTSNSSSEIPCRVTGLPDTEVIPYNDRLITGKPSSYAALQGRRSSEKVIPWEVRRRRLDPVTTDRPCPHGREIAFRPALPRQSMDAIRRRPFGQSRVPLGVHLRLRRRRRLLHRLNRSAGDARGRLGGEAELLRQPER